MRLGLHRLALATPIAATGWIDRYGQRGNLEWPLKVRADADLKAADKREMAELAKANRPPSPNPPPCSFLALVWLVFGGQEGS